MSLACSGFSDFVCRSTQACNNYYVVLETHEKSVIVTERMSDGSLQLDMTDYLSLSLYFAGGTDRIDGAPCCCFV